ncbi:TetR/AcrR family transcriptional regulator [Chengkuizengella sp. 2205SS18-9]|uniref:TetR/AcrR family transcriptional regulator n=2 Tax=Chengkuizengella axinellae TaxID=3064388 RepID=A0ABT9IVB0_9BACL|nr:TetR/AcrR family transcriptional regulator [Chengkuizengella sp. 2205SS18-9]MDP5273296.1 TetR/AcrR family transcriptional regulator [Chengkuizengella sp. 2205SS18-9]
MEQWIKELLEINDEDEKKTDKQLKIIKAAVEVFSEKGYSASSTNEIAKKAGVAEGTIFRHYKTKKDLLISIVAPKMGKLVAPFILRDVEKLLSDTHHSYEDFLRELIMNRIKFIKKHTAVLKILLQEIPFQPDLQALFVKHVASIVYDRMHKIVDHFQKKEEIISVPPPSVIRFTVSTVMGHLLVRYFILPNIEWDDEQEIDHTINFIMYGISSIPRNEAEPNI